MFQLDFYIKALRNFGQHVKTTMNTLYFTCGLPSRREWPTRVIVGHSRAHLARLAMLIFWRAPFSHEFFSPFPSFFSIISHSSLTHLSLISHPFPTHNHLSPIFQPPLAFFSPSPSITMPPPPRIFRRIAVCVILSRFILHWRQSSVSKPISRVK